MRVSPALPERAEGRRVERVTAQTAAIREDDAPLAGAVIADVVTMNGVRMTLEDGTRGLVRTSANKPELVVMVGRPVSQGHMRATFAMVDGVLRESSEVGTYNQQILRRASFCSGAKRRFQSFPVTR
ncbi:hypothetical protein GCM10011322_47290 [Salinarimonas ramus]|uniref:Uncharacterized protein n=1 Tax=Salinarimonas ramus TaxID=690164 RepID=A0A917QL37_9HYPH|nr:hypothetical protein GCM10011322_47290 [Salinarimonas ramus]